MTIFVASEHAEPAHYSEDVYTIGLETCIAVCAYGLPAQEGGVNKVLAHISPGHEAEVMDTLFVPKVQSSGMTLYGVCISRPHIGINDNMTNSKMKDIMEEAGVLALLNIHRSQVTNEMIQRQKQGMRERLREGYNYVLARCEALGARVTPYTRPTDNGVMTAWSSPGGTVVADNLVMANIPDWPTASSSSRSRGAHSSSGGGGSSFQHRSTGHSSGGHGSSGQSSHHRSHGSSSHGDYYKSSGHSSSSHQRSGGSSHRDDDYHKSSGGGSSSRHHKSSRSKYSR